MDWWGGWCRRWGGVQNLSCVLNTVGRIAWTPSLWPDSRVGAVEGILLCVAVVKPGTSSDGVPGDSCSLGDAQCLRCPRFDAGIGSSHGHYFVTLERVSKRKQWCMDFCRNCSWYSGIRGGGWCVVVRMLSEAVTCSGVKPENRARMTLCSVKLGFRPVVFGSKSWHFRRCSDPVKPIQTS